MRIHASTDKELVKMNSCVDTDEIISWCYLNDII